MWQNFIQNIILQTLNPKQTQAVRHIHTPLLVLAGAGSGKTRVITQKIAYLIRQGYYKAYQITAVTFTNKASREMKARVKGELATQDTRGLTVSTFHTLGLKIIRQELAHLPLKYPFSIYDSNDSKKILSDILDEILHQSGHEPWYELDELVSDASYHISHWKNHCISPKQVPPAKLDIDLINEVFIPAYQLYVDRLRQYNALDFDDLIVYPVQLFRQHSTIRQKWQRKIRYLLIDEYQDTNMAQYELVRLLTTRIAQSDQEPSRLTVVGDDDQSIYGWRGARPENLATLKQDYPDLEVIKLEQNYRSSGRILKLANTLIDNNPHVFQKSLWSDLDYGEKVKVIQAKDEHHEVELVVADIVSKQYLQPYQYGDFAILYRGNFQSRLFEKQLRLQQIPYQISGGPSFFSYTEIKDVLAYFRLLVNPDDDAALLRIINTPKRKIGATTLEKLCGYAKQTNQPLLSCCHSLGLREHLEQNTWQRLREFYQWIENISALAETTDPINAIKQLLMDLDYHAWQMQSCSSDAKAERAIANIDELVDWLQRLYERAIEDSYHNETVPLSDLLNKIMLITILENAEQEAQTDCVSLMTLHSAKGLEFPVVYMIGMEEELLPHRTSIEEDSIEEERRLCYVGITRAQQQLIFSLTRERRRYGENNTTQPSRFLYELPEEDLQWIKGREALGSKEKKQVADQSLAKMRAILGKN